MARKGYLDFDLLIERGAEGYIARVLNSPAGQAAAGFRLPFSKLQLENFLLRVGRTRRGVRRLDSPEMEAAKVFGARYGMRIKASYYTSSLFPSATLSQKARLASLRLRRFPRPTEVCSTTTPAQPSCDGQPCPAR
jgi:hypothetical protein